MSTKIPYPTLSMPRSGEHFQMLQSSHGSDGHYRFLWTLSAGKKGPEPHMHPHEHETFEVQSGTLHIWLDGTLNVLGAGESLVVKPGVGHRFFNPGPEPAVARVSLDGPRLEDQMMPMAIFLRDNPKPGLIGILRILVHVGRSMSDGTVAAVDVPGKVVYAIFIKFARIIAFCGVQSLEPAERWDVSSQAQTL
ncbi:MAG: cupin domain-containing protein [Bradymonadaceae bacterium]|nr:cupin domain-containing protein [Lujinxingiaceae bacterium]